MSKPLSALSPRGARVSEGGIREDEQEKQRTADPLTVGRPRQQGPCWSHSFPPPPRPWQDLASPSEKVDSLSLETKQMPAGKYSPNEHPPSLNHTHCFFILLLLLRPSHPYPTSSSTYLLACSPCLRSQSQLSRRRRRHRRSRTSPPSRLPPSATLRPSRASSPNGRPIISRELLLARLPTVYCLSYDVLTKQLFLPRLPPPSRSHCGRSNL